ncbi:MAG TPA: hypothetical protein PK773_04280, partial [Aminivibrio sp.]|nr:hypothetical protein [Aminivibrio sp.]
MQLFLKAHALPAVSFQLLAKGLQPPRGGRHLIIELGNLGSDGKKFPASLIQARGRTPLLFRQSIQNPVSESKGLFLAGELHLEHLFHLSKFGQLVLCLGCTPANARQFLRKTRDALFQTLLLFPLEPDAAFASGNFTFEPITFLLGLGKLFFLLQQAEFSFLKSQGACFDIPGIGSRSIPQCSHLGFDMFFVRRQSKISGNRENQFDFLQLLPVLSELLGFFCLTLERIQLSADFRNNITDAQQVLLGNLDFLQGNLLPRLELGNACCFLNDQPAFLRLGTEDHADLSLLDNRIRL